MSRNPKVDFFAYQDPARGHACIATQNISKGEVLVSIPFSECLIGRDEVELVDMIERAPDDTDWGEYISFIRSSNVLLCVPILWDDVRLEQLHKVPSLSALCDCLYRNLKKSWASAYMLSRSFELSDGRIASVPVGDMFNHSTEYWNTRIRETEKGFTFIAEQDIPTGSEILNNYGSWYDAMTMFVTHGFFEECMVRDVLYVGVGDEMCVIGRDCDENVKRRLREMKSEFLGDLLVYEFENPLLKRLAQADYDAWYRIIQNT